MTKVTINTTTGNRVTLNEQKTDVVRTVGIGGGDGTSSDIGPPFDKANSANILAQSAIITANAAFDAANAAAGGSISGAYGQANSATYIANLAFNTANAAFNAANNVVSGGPAYDTANAAYDKANSANLIAVSSFTLANSTNVMTYAYSLIAAAALSLGNTNQVIANLAYDKANAANVLAASAIPLDFDYIDFPTIAEPATPGAGFKRIFSVNEGGFSALETKSEDGAIVRLGQDTYRIARNTTGATILKGQLVCFTGSTGQIPNVGLALGVTEATMPAIGMAIADVAINARGRFFIIGRIDGLNTSSFTEGDALYVSSTVAGSYQNTAPPHPYLSQSIGTVERSHATQGAILINIAAQVSGREFGTNRNVFTIGDETAGAKSVRFDNGFLMTLSGNPDANVTLTLPSVTTTLLGSSNIGTTVQGYSANLAGWALINPLIANASYDKANSANIIADTAFARANLAYTFAANNAFLVGNSAYAGANSTYTYAANNVMLVANLAFGNANSTYTYAANTVMSTANAAYAKANAANIIADNAFAKANLAYTFAANNAHLTANSAYAAANQAYTYAANNVQLIANLAFGNANTTYTYAANTVMSVANAAFSQANGANIVPVGNTMSNGYFTVRSSKRRVNFIPGTNITINVDDDPTLNTANITIAASVTGGDPQYAFERANIANLQPVGNTMSNGYYTIRSTKNQLNFIPGTNITINVDEDATLNTSNITITSTATGGGGVAVSAVAPASPTANDLWWSSETATLYVYYDDGTSSQWVEASPGDVIANGAMDTAIAAYIAANTTWTYAANDVMRTANSAYAAGNTTWTYAANNVQLIANSAYAGANNTYTYAANDVMSAANAAFARANAANGTANSTYTYAANTVQLIANSAYAQANVANNTANSTCIMFIIDGGGTAITTGEKGCVEVPFACDIIRWSLLADQSGTLNIDIHSAPYSTTVFPGMANSMSGNLGMTLSASRANQSTNMTNWRGTRINAGNVVCYNVMSTATITRLTVSLYCNKLGH